MYNNKDLSNAACAYAQEIGHLYQADNKTPSRALSAYPMKSGVEWRRSPARRLTCIGNHGEERNTIAKYPSS